MYIFIFIFIFIFLEKRREPTWCKKQNRNKKIKNKKTKKQNVKHTSQGPKLFHSGQDFFLFSLPEIQPFLHVFI